MNGLETVNFSSNTISDITPLKDKKILNTITLHQNDVVDISVLATCPKLFSLNISYNHVLDITALYGLEELYDLTAYEDLDKKIIPRSQIAFLEGEGVYVSYHE